MKQILKYTAMAITAMILCILPACKSGKNAQHNSLYDSNHGIGKMLSGYSEWNTLSASGKVKLQLGSNSLSSAIQLKMERGKWINISVRPFLGIEMAKLYINSDTAYFIDKSSSRHYKEALPLIGKKRISIESIQAALIGRAFTITEGELTLKNIGQAKIKKLNDGNTEITPEEQLGKAVYSFIIDEAHHINKAILTVGSGTLINVDYGDYYQSNLPRQINIGISKNPLKASIEFKDNVQWNKDLDPNFEIPRNSKLTPISNILKY